MKVISFAQRGASLLAGALLLLPGAYSVYSQDSTANFQTTITTPTNGSSFIAPANIPILASVFDASNEVAYVVFMATPGGGGIKPAYELLLGTVSNSLPTVPPGSLTRLFAFTWTNPPTGTWSLIADAVRSNGVDAVSAPVTVNVQSGHVISVDIASPTNGAVFSAPADMELIAGASETGGAIAYVEFFDGANSLGVVSNGVVVDPPGSPGLPPGTLAYLLSWTNVPAGIHVLTAAATDTNGQSAVSAPVKITVGSNLPPVVRITSPANNSVFRAPMDIALLAYAVEPGGYVSSVEFFAGSKSLGFGQPLSSPGQATPLAGTPGPVGPPIFLTNMFELVWSNVPPGAFALTAVATGDTGASATSPPVNITVVLPPPPPTNKPDIVSIVATDPIAIAGTNCWPWLGLPSTPATWSNWVSPTANCRWFTNCGPKDAIVAIRRFGATNDDLTVAYSIGGTASNGVDYVLLPGAATIPAGQVETMITIIPTGGETNNALLTVVLSLEPSTNSPPDYLPGGPRRAEALILEKAPPPTAVTASALADHSFLLSAQGPDGAWFRVDYTTDGLTWTPVCTNQVFVGSIYFADPDAASFATRWYRTIPLPNPPSD